MRGLDTNLIVYAHRSDMPEHFKAQAIISEFIQSEKLFAVAWPSFYEFYRLVTHGKVFRVPSSREQALSVIRSFFEIPYCRVLSHSVAHWENMESLCKEADVRGNLAFDVQIAAIMLDHGVEEVISNDGDFLRFNRLKVINPFTES